MRINLIRTPEQFVPKRARTSIDLEDVTAAFE